MCEALVKCSLTVEQMDVCVSEERAGVCVGVCLQDPLLQGFYYAAAAEGKF